MFENVTEGETSVRTILNGARLGALYWHRPAKALQSSRGASMSCNWKRAVGGLLAIRDLEEIESSPLFNRSRRRRCIAGLHDSHAKRSKTQVRKLENALCSRLTLASSEELFEY